jgi:hypothetical protein
MLCKPTTCSSQVMFHVLQTNLLCNNPSHTVSLFLGIVAHVGKLTNYDHIQTLV